MRANAPKVAMRVTSASSRSPNAKTRVRSAMRARAFSGHQLYRDVHRTVIFNGNFVDTSFVFNAIDCFSPPPITSRFDQG
jgi:hypothetical protein